MLFPVYLDIPMPPLENYITKNDPAFFIESGSAGQNVPTQQLVIFAEKLKNGLVEDKVHLTILEGPKHGGSQFKTSENLEKVFKFLDGVLK